MPAEPTHRPLLHPPAILQWTVACGHWCSSSRHRRSGVCWPRCTSFAACRAFTFAILLPATLSSGPHRHLRPAGRRRAGLAGGDDRRSRRAPRSLRLRSVRLPGARVRRSCRAGVAALPLFKVFRIRGADPSPALYRSSRISSSPCGPRRGLGYHFSNGITFGVMYMAMIGEASRRSWLWAILLAMGPELAMLITPYAASSALPSRRCSWPSRFPRFDSLRRVGLYAKGQACPGHCGRDGKSGVM